MKVLTYMLIFFEIHNLHYLNSLMLLLSSKSLASVLLRTKYVQLCCACVLFFCLFGLLLFCLFLFFSLVIFALWLCCYEVQFRREPDSSWLWIKESIIGMVYCACLTVRSNSHCGVKNDVCTCVVRLLSPVHF